MFFPKNIVSPKLVSYGNNKIDRGEINVERGKIHGRTERWQRGLERSLTRGPSRDAQPWVDTPASDWRLWNLILEDF